MDSLSSNSPQINPASPSAHPQNPDEMQIENLPSTLDTKETLTNQATTATPLRISTSSSGENGTVQEPIVIGSPQQDNKEISNVLIIDDVPSEQQQPQDSTTIQVENPKASVRSAVFPDQSKASSIVLDNDSEEDQPPAKGSEKKSVTKISFINKSISFLSKYLSSASKSKSKSPSPVNVDENPIAQPESITDFAVDANLKAISDLHPIEEAAKEISQRMEIITVATENIVIEQKEDLPEESHNIMDRPPKQDDPYLADSNMLFGFRPQTSPCDPTTSPTKLARYNSLMSQGSDLGKVSTGYKFGANGEDSRGIDVRGDLMAMMNAENSMPVDAGVVREEYEEHETEETEEKTSQKKVIKMTKVERVQTIINGNIVKESPKRSEEPDNKEEIEVTVETIVHTMAIETENEAKYQPSLGEVVELNQSPVKEQISSPKEVREEENIAQEEATVGEMSVKALMDEERRKSEVEPVPMRHSKTPNYLERKLQKIQEDNLKSMGDFEFKKKTSKLEQEKMEAKQNEVYKPKAQLQKVQETKNSTFMSDTKQHFSKLQLEKMASKAKEGTQSAMQKTQPRNTSKSPVPPQRKVVTPNPIPSKTINKPTISSGNRNTTSHLKRKFDALKPSNGQNVPVQTAGHDMKKVKLTEELNISSFSLAESVVVNNENMPGNINIQASSLLQSTKRDTSATRVSGGMPKTATAKNCVFCGDAFANKGDTKMMSCLHKAHTNCYVQMERRKKASCPLCNSNASPISTMYAMPKPVAYKF